MKTRDTYFISQKDIFSKKKNKLSCLTGKIMAQYPKNCWEVERSTPVQRRGEMRSKQRPTAKDVLWYKQRMAMHEFILLKAVIVKSPIFWHFYSSPIFFLVCDTVVLGTTWQQDCWRIIHAAGLWSTTQAGTLTHRYQTIIQVIDQISSPVTLRGGF